MSGRVSCAVGVSPVPGHNTTGTTCGVITRGYLLSGGHIEGYLLSGGHIEGYLLSEAHIEGYLLSGGHIEGYLLSGGHIEGYLLSGGHIEGYLLSEAHIVGYLLSEAHIEGYLLSEAHIEGYLLSGGHIEGYLLSGGHIEGYLLSEGHIQGYLLSGGHIEGYLLSEGHIEGYLLSEGHIDGYFLYGGHIEGYLLSEGHIEGYLLSEGHIEGYLLSGGHIEGYLLSGGHIEGYLLSEGHIEGYLLSGGHIEGYLLSGGHIEGYLLSGGHIEGYLLSEGHIEGYLLSGGHIEGYLLSGGHIEGYLLSGGHIEGYLLSEGHIQGYLLSGGHIEGYLLSEGHIEGYLLSEGHIDGYFLYGGHIEGYLLSEAHIEGYLLSEGHIEGYLLSEGHIEGYLLSGGHIEGYLLSDGHIEGYLLCGGHIDGYFLYGGHIEGYLLSEGHIEGYLLSGGHIEGYLLSGGHIVGYLLSAGHIEGYLLSGGHIEGYLLSCTWCRVVRVPSGPLLRVEGTEVTIPCDVSDYEGPLEQNFDWTFSSGGDASNVISTWDNVFTDPAYRDRVEVGGIQLQRKDNSRVLLRIRQLSASDEGTYTCSTPSTDATFSGNYQDHVQIKVIPDTLKLSGARGRLASSRNVTKGGVFQLYCQASSSADAFEHTHFSLSWERRSDNANIQVLTLTHLGRIQPGSEYKTRYSSGEVRLDTVGTDGYQLTVDQVQASDAGEYSCVAGTWVEAPDGWEKIQEKRVVVTRVDVQPISLSVTVPVSDIEVKEGLPFNLSCWVTHDSDGPVLTRVYWVHSMDSGETRELPGEPDPDPSSDGGIHQLIVPHAWDSGTYSCRATLWALYGNGTWYPVVEKASDPVTVRVISSAPVFTVLLKPTILPLYSEEPTELMCHVSGLEDTRVSVSWYFTPSSPAASALLLGSLDQDWTLHVGPGYQERLESGGLIFSRRDPRTFVLRIQWTTEVDRGNYHCAGIAWKQDRNASWVLNAEVNSLPVNLYWKEEESALAVTAQLTKMVSTAGGTFEMLCTVSAKNIPAPRYTVQVTVEMPLAHSRGPAPVIFLSRDGLTKRQVDGSSTMLERVKEGLYRFRIYQAQAQDSGQYRCSVTVWTQGGGGAWREVRNRTSDPVQLEFQTTGPEFNVTAYSDSPSVYRGERAEFWCIITFNGPAMDPGDVAFEVSWFSQRVAGLATHLVTVDRAAHVRHSRRNGTSEVSLERISNMEFRLRIYNCEEEDAGGHYCAVIPWVRTGEGGWNQQADITSNVISMSVKMDLIHAFRYPLLIGVGLSLVAGLLSCLIGYCSSRLCCKTPPKREPRREHRRLMPMEMD
ncbi:prostaglandin F2 receptor negative regulator [Pelodytes ibericus]